MKERRITIEDVFSRLNDESKRVLRLLQREGPLTKGALLEAVKTNFTTLNRIIQPLREARLVHGVGIGESSGGRKPVLYDLNPKGFYVLGLDISRSYTQIVIADPKMVILDKSVFPMDETCTPDETAQRVTRLFAEALNRLGLEKDKFLGAGLGAVGPLDRRRGVMIQPANFPAPGWSGTGIKDLLERHLGLPVEIDNGGNTAVLAEHTLGVGRNHANVAYFNCSVGIRTGVISGGEIVRGLHDAEDAFGHMVIDVDGEPCACGNYGCVDCYASINAIVKKYFSSIKRGRRAESDKPPESLDYADICRYADNGEPLAREVVLNAAIMLGVGLANYINLLNPELVILNGPLISHSDLYYQTCIQTASNRLYAKKPKQVAFSKGGSFADDAIALGAALMVVGKRLF